MINLKILTAQDLLDVQLHCEKAIQTSIGNFKTGFGRMEDLFEIAKVMEMLTMCRACDAPAEKAEAKPAVKRAA